VLPPEHHIGPVEPIYAAAEQAVTALFKSQLSYSDILAFHAIVQDHKDHRLQPQVLLSALARLCGGSAVDIVRAMDEGDGQRGRSVGRVGVQRSTAEACC
jgi:hypothetical protein